MGKDPAILWYWNDWLGGTFTLSRFLKGCYMDLLAAQHNTGHLSLDEIKTVLGSDFGSSWPTLQKKFVTDDKGLYYNARAKKERESRRTFTESRRKNLKSSPHMGDHMEDRDENEDMFFLSLIPNTWNKDKYLILLKKWLQKRKRKPDHDLIALRVGELVAKHPSWIDAERIMTESVYEGWQKLVYDKATIQKESKSKTPIADTYAGR